MHTPLSARTGATAGLLLRQFPLQPITNKTLEGKGSFETIGFKRLFCPLFQLLGKVGRRRHVLPGRTAEFFSCPRSGSVSRRKSIPCLGGIWEAALVHTKGSAETMGFCWRSLVTFCRYWQKVTRRRPKKKKLLGKVGHRRQSTEAVEKSRPRKSFFRGLL